MANPIAGKPSGMKPKLAVTTPVTASFPRDKASSKAHLSAVSLPSSAAVSEPQQTPLSAVSRSSAFRDLPSAGRLPMSAGPGTAVFPRRDEPKTPITPPVAYIDFLRGMALQSPSTNGPVPGTSCAASTGSECDDDKDKTMPSSTTTTSAASSAPVSASSTGTDLSCKCESPDHPGLRTIPPVSVPGLQVPPSPVALAATAAAAGETPLSALTTPASPFSSVRSSPFDWDAAMQAARRRSAEGVVTTTTTTTTKETNAPVIAGTKRDGGLGPAVKHVREVVTRTVTYTPRVGPAPKGKRRKMDHETAREP